MKNIYFLHQIDDLLYQLNKTKFYTKLDIYNGYWKIYISFDDVFKIIFHINYTYFIWSYQHICDDHKLYT